MTDEEKQLTLDHISRLVVKLQFQLTGLGELLIQKGVFTREELEAKVKALLVNLDQEMESERIERILKQRPKV